MGNESIEQLLYAYPSLHALLSYLEHYRSDVRKLEKLAVHALLQEMTGLSNPIINHNPDGRPIFEGWEISVSHTRGMAAVILRENDDNNISSLSPVAIDIEYGYRYYINELPILATLVKGFQEQQQMIEKWDGKLPVVSGENGMMIDFDNLIENTTQSKQEN